MLCLVIVIIIYDCGLIIIANNHIIFSICPALFKHTTHIKSFNSYNPRGGTIFPHLTDEDMRHREVE